MLQVLAKKYFEEEWLATGNNATFLAPKSGVGYVVAEFAKPQPGPGWVMADLSVTVRIPLVTQRMPQCDTYYRIRRRLASDPPPPNYADIGSFLYAESTGRYQAR